MDNLFIKQLLLSIVVAGTWISLATLLSERLGSKLGGMISNLPSTILVSLLFIGITQSPEFAAASTKTVPLGMFLCTIFLYVFIALVNKGLILATVGGLLAWGVSALISSLFQNTGMNTWAALYFLSSATTYLLAEHRLKIPSMGRTGKKYTPFQVLMRALFAGSVVGLAVVVGRSGSAFWTGIFATFPAVMLSSMVILTMAAGAGFARATGKIMLLASTNIVIYGYVAGYLFPRLGLMYGTLISFGISFLWVAMLRPMLNKSK